MATKHEMLTRIRGALAREEGAAFAPLLPFEGSTGSAGGEEPVARFSAELQRAAAWVKRVGAAREIKDYLEGLLAGDSRISVAVSDSIALKQMGLREWLESRAVGVLPSLREFIAGSRRDSPSSSSDEGAAERQPGSSIREDYKRALLGVGLGVTSADYGIADTGTLVLLSGGEQHRMISLVPPLHVCLLDSSRIVSTLAELISRVRTDAYSLDPPPQAMTFITGPSRTADIELSLTLGVHGPRELHVLLTGPS